MTFFILPLLSERDLDIGPEGRYLSRADDKGNMKIVLLLESLLCWWAEFRTILRVI
jgi:hypothetical protein